MNREQVVSRLPALPSVGCYFIVQPTSKTANMGVLSLLRTGYGQQCRLVNKLRVTHLCVIRRNTAKTSFPMRLNDLI